MNETLQTILTRRSVRSFQTDKAIAKEDLQQIVTCARMAPSARNEQQWMFTVVTDKKKIETLAKAVGAALGAASYDFYKPNALILCSAKRDFRFAMQDCACAMENIFLAAHSLGIGSVWINQLLDTCDDAGVRAVLTSFGLPQEQLVVGVAALGYAKAPANLPPKKDEEQTVLWVE